MHSGASPGRRLKEGAAKWVPYKLFRELLTINGFKPDFIQKSTPKLQPFVQKRQGVEVIDAEKAIESLI